MSFEYYWHYVALIYRQESTDKYALLFNIQLPMFLDLSEILLKLMIEIIALTLENTLITSDRW